MTTHKVTCNVAKDKCADNWYAPGYISSRSGCCHCQASCVITGYQPGSDVIQHSLIDLDQKEMEAHLGTTPVAFDKAKQIYTLGGNSGATAQLTVGALGAAITKGTSVTQGGTATGKVKSDAKQGDTTLVVSYSSTCKVGGSSTQIATGCFVTTAAVKAGDKDIGQPTAVVNKYRTLAGFSTAALAKMKGQPFYVPYRAYYTHGDYADRYVTAALDGTGAFKSQPEAARIQGAKKGSAYMNVWMYVIREMEDAIADCKSGCLKCNDDPVHAWDEGVAFYSGSLEGVDGSGSGKMLHALADKRCKNYMTCTESGGSKVNEEIIAQFKLGQARLLEGKCVEVVPHKKRIVELMSVPLVQGALRYAYKVAKLSGGAKEKGEGAAFAAAILPRVAHCNADAAKLISDNMKIDAAAPMTAGYAAIKTAFESTFTCMGIKCADVGGLIVSGTTYYEGAEPCVGSITGYDPGSDVYQHSLLDLDQKEMESHLGASPPDFAAAKTIYNGGGNSGAYAQVTIPALAEAVGKGMVVTQGSVAIGHAKSTAAKGATSLTISYASTCKVGGLPPQVQDATGCFTTSSAISAGSVDIGQPSAVTNKYRTLAGFSTAAQSKMTGQEYYEVYRKYYAIGDYAHQYVMSALDKTGAFAAQEDVARVEGAKKGCAYMNVWLYVIREMEDAILDCKSGCLQCNDDPVHAWDEGVAFYSGSLEGADGSGSGKMLHALADKRCK